MGLIPALLVGRMLGDADAKRAGVHPPLNRLGPVSVREQQGQASQVAQAGDESFRAGDKAQLVVFDGRGEPAPSIFFDSVKKQFPDLGRDNALLLGLDTLRAVNAPPVARHRRLDANRRGEIDAPVPHNVESGHFGQVNAEFEGFARHEELVRARSIPVAWVVPSLSRW